MLVFKKGLFNYKQIQKVNIGDHINKELLVDENLPSRPHFVVYDDQSDLFFVALSWGSKILMYKNVNGKLTYVNEYSDSDLFKRYIKFINIIDGKLYCCTNKVKVFNIVNNQLVLLNEYEYPKDMEFTDQVSYLTKIDDYYYMCYWSIDGLIRMKSLFDLQFGNYENISDKFQTKGFPYTISQIEDKYYLCEIVDCQRIISFNVSDNNIHNINVIYEFDDLSEESIARKKIDPILQ